ncbi:MAG: two-component regulator propeller domain-containing protein [Candidatus Marinimicrobia bacterium]|nr:two-component regulator propeller domain-containing protein [Candidatus Neomarinimicrobiota bacterium]
MKKKVLKIIILNIFLLGVVFGRSFIANTFTLNDTLPDSIAYKGIGSNGVSDIHVKDDSTLLFATGAGLSITYNAGESFYTYYNSFGSVAYGGVSAMTSLGDKIWVATAYDSVISGESLPVGNGISYSENGGHSWKHFPQMTDHPDSNFVIYFGDTLDALPITVAVQNITYDLAVNVNSDGDTILWATSWAGGTRCSYDLGKNWKRVILPPDDMDTLDENSSHDFDLSPTSGNLGFEENFNHMSFSVVAFDDTIAVGTAAGINISYDSGITWRKYNAQNSDISGNFVRALYKDENGKIYGAALPANDPNEYYSLVYSKVDGSDNLQWSSTLKNKQIYNSTSDGNYVFAGTEDGLYISSDGWSWVKNGGIMDDAGVRIYSEKIYDVTVDNNGNLWIGTGDGLAKSIDQGVTWEIIRRIRSLPDLNKLDMSVYPNPFSPSRMNLYNNDGYSRIHCNFPKDGSATLEIFDFGMNKAKTIMKDVLVVKGEKDFVWDCKNGMNDVVANGTYFIKLTFNSGDKKEIDWTKLIILD